MRRCRILALVLLPALQLWGQSDQSPKSFEVASVKRLEQPNPATSSGGGPGTSDPGRWWRSNVTLLSLLVQAFHMQGHAIVAPEWLRTTRYEISASVPPGTTREDVPLMIQRLLAERFGLTFHRESKEMPGYALVIRRNGPKLQPATGSPAPIPPRKGFPDLAQGVAPGVIQVDSDGPVRRFAAGAMSMAQFADYLAAQTDGPVADLTELPAKYDIVLYYSRPQADDGMDLLSALRDQLGLDLQPRKTRVNVLVVDHIDQTPSPN